MELFRKIINEICMALMLEIAAKSGSTCSNLRGAANISKIQMQAV